MYDGASTPDRIGDNEIGESPAVEPRKKAWTPPRLVELQPGTAAYERAVAAFGSREDAARKTPSDPHGSK